MRLKGQGSVPGYPGHQLTYRWRVVRKPAGSSPRLRGVATARPKLRLRQPGRYTVAMTVTEQGLDETPERLTDLVQEGVAPSAPPAGAPIDTMAQHGDQTGIRVGTSPTRFYPAPPDGQIGVVGLDPGMLSSDPDLNTVIPDSSDVDSAVKDAVAKFTKGTLVIVTARDCCSASSKLLPKSGAFSYITSYDGNKDDFGQSGTWNRNPALTDNHGTSHPPVR